jgi:YVTN family beta-propeller protein
MKVCVANAGSNNIYAINSATNTFEAQVSVGNIPASFGQFIGKPSPTITWNNPADIVYGTPLNSTQLDATSSVHGTFVYTPAAGTVLGVGTHTLNVFFTPTDIINYTTTSASVSINVVTNPGNSFGNGVTFTNLGNNNVYIINPATNNLEAAAFVGYMSSSSRQFWSYPVVPTITWNNPANINYGTVLSSIQLDATSSVPGTFVYTPQAGTVLGVGTQALNAFFTPNDLVHYTNTSASVLINVVNNSCTFCECGVTFKPNPINQTVDLLKFPVGRNL